MAPEMYRNAMNPLMFMLWDVHAPGGRLNITSAQGARTLHRSTVSDSVSPVRTDW